MQLWIKDVYMYVLKYKADLRDLYMASRVVHYRHSMVGKSIYPNIQEHINRLKENNDA